MWNGGEWKEMRAAISLSLIGIFMPESFDYDRQAIYAAVCHWLFHRNPVWLLELESRKLLFERTATRLADKCCACICEDRNITPEQVVGVLDATNHPQESSFLRELLAEALDPDMRLPSRLEFDGCLDALEVAREKRSTKQLGNLLMDVAVLVDDGRIQSRYEVAEQVRKLLDDSDIRSKGTQFKEAASLSDFPDMPPATLLIEDLVYEQAFTILAGDPKSRKTTLACQMALTLVTGSPTVLERAIYKPCPVAIVEVDMNESHLVGLLKKLGRGMGIAAPFEEKLRWWCPRGLDLAQAEHRAKLLDEIATMRPGLVVLDCLRNLHTANDDKSEELVPILGAFLELRDRCGTSVLVVDHVAKGSIQPGGNIGYAVRGSGAKFAAADTVLVAQDQDGVTKLHGIHRHGPGLEPLWYRYEEVGDGARLELCQDPAEGDGKGSTPQERVRQFFESNHGWHSQSGVQEVVRMKKESIRKAVSSLHGRNLIEHDGKHPNVRLWRWVQKGQNGVGPECGTNSDQLASGLGPRVGPGGRDIPFRGYPPGTNSERGPGWVDPESRPRPEIREPGEEG